MPTLAWAWHPAGPIRRFKEVKMVKMAKFLHVTVLAVLGFPDPLAAPTR